MAQVKLNLEEGKAVSHADSYSRNKKNNYKSTRSAFVVKRNKTKEQEIEKKDS
jgi:hypothetical protein